MRTIERINKALRKAGAPDDVRLVRYSAGGGYYNLTGCDFAYSSSLYVYSLDDTPKDYRLAAEHVNSVLKECGIDVSIPLTY